MKMKLTKLLFLLATVCVTLIACSDDDENGGVIPPTEPEADYTVMMYGCGGGNLDYSLIYNLTQAETYGYTPRVQFTAQLKFSKEIQKIDEANYGGTRLFTMTESGMQNERIGAQGFRLDDPKNIADFINETKKRLPAKHYILILWNHGDSFSIDDQPVENAYPEQVVSRSLVFDDNNEESISIFELEEGLKRSATKLDMVYWDVCLMNMIENIYQIKSYTNYVLGAAHLTPGLGGNYTQLLMSLDNHDNLLEAMKEYIPGSVELWKEAYGDDRACDLTLCDMNHIDDVVKYVKEYVDVFCHYKEELKDGSQEELEYQYFNGTSQSINAALYSEGGLLYYFDNEDADSYSPSVDMYSAFSRMASNLMDGTLSGISTKIKKAVSQMTTVKASFGLPAYMNQVSVGLMWMDQAGFTAKNNNFKVTSLSELYPMLKFDQATGWSRFLSKNVKKNVGLKISIDKDFNIMEEYYVIEDTNIE